MTVSVVLFALALIFCSSRYGVNAVLAFRDTVQVIKRGRSIKRARAARLASVGNSDRSRSL